jgi:hypothetical protein
MVRIYECLRTKCNAKRHNDVHATESEAAEGQPHTADDTSHHHDQSTAEPLGQDDTHRN